MNIREITNPNIPSYMRTIKGFMKSYSNKYFSIESNKDTNIFITNIQFIY